MLNITNIWMFKQNSFENKELKAIIINLGFDYLCLQFIIYLTHEIITVEVLLLMLLKPIWQNK